MPAPKGIPIPEVRAFRLDERILDSRTTKGWMSDDERLIATHTGGVLFDIDLNCAHWDENTEEMIFLMMIFLMMKVYMDVRQTPIL